MWIAADNRHATGARNTSAILTLIRAQPRARPGAARRLLPLRHDNENSVRLSRQETQFGQRKERRPTTTQERAGETFFEP
jgi:hypothetical protein